MSQAYAVNNGQFKSPPWMKVLTREYNDPFSYTHKQTGGLNIIDLANVYSCSFIASQDLGKIHENYFERYIVSRVSEKKHVVFQGALPPGHNPKSTKISKNLSF